MLPLVQQLLFSESMISAFGNWVVLKFLKGAGGASRKGNATSQAPPLWP